MESAYSFKKYQKIAIFGDNEVGKTSIIKRLSGNQIDLTYEKTKGIKSSIIELKKNEEIINVNFFEVNLNENFSTILDNIIKGCRIILLVFDLSNKLSYDKILLLMNKLKEIKNYCNINKIIIANKTDLKEDSKYDEELNYDKSEIKKYENQDNYEIIQMSTLTNDNLHLLRRNILEISDDKDLEHSEVLIEESDGFSKPSSKAERTLNIMLLGEPKVGKTSFFGKFFENDRFDDNYMITVGVDKKSKLIKLNKTFFNLQIWDTAGQEVYQSMTKSYYKKSDGLILIYDVTDENSFLKVEKWIKEIENNANKNIIVYLVGNKIDLVDMRVVEKEKAENVAKSFGKKYFEISAKLNINLRETVYSLVKEIHSKNGLSSLQSIHIIKEDIRENNANSCCLSNKRKKK